MRFIVKRGQGNEQPESRFVGLPLAAWRSLGAERTLCRKRQIPPFRHLTRVRHHDSAQFLGHPPSRRRFIG
jgi:hypothetical protein